MKTPKGFEPLSYVNEGQVVWFPIGRDLMRGTVVAAMGYTVRVVNEKRGVDTWFHVNQVFQDKRSSSA